MDEKNILSEKLSEETQTKHPKKTVGRKQKVRIFKSFVVRTELDSDNVFPVLS